MTGQLLVAMPQMRDARFTRTVIYICAHTSDGAMGLVINRLVGSLTFPDLLEQLGILSAESGRIRDAVYARNLDALTDQGRFLRDKFHRSELDLGG